MGGRPVDGVRTGSKVPIVVAMCLIVGVGIVRVASSSSTSLSSLVEGVPRRNK
jgi:hypothetical protein